VRTEATRAAPGTHPARQGALLLAALATALFGCGALRGPEVDPKEHVRGEHQRLVPQPVERLWPALLAALADEGVRVSAADERRGTIMTRPVRHAESDAPRRLAEIGDVSEARQAGLGRLSEFIVTYYLLLAPAADAGTSLRIRSSIEAIDRNLPIFVGPGFFPVERRIPVPSRGVVERDLMRRLAAALFTEEEMLFLLGEPGVD